MPASLGDYDRQHFLNLRPLPQGQGESRPTGSATVGGKGRLRPTAELANGVYRIPLKPAEDKAALEKLLKEGLTKRERLVLEKVTSNQEFHDLGSAKILGGIGKGLAEAMIELKITGKTK